MDPKVILERTPGTWEDLITELYDDDWDDRIKRHRSSYAFRGMLDSSWEMKTSLIRLGGDFHKLEKHLLRNFRKYAHKEVVERDSFWHWLAVAQHHGLPTRLLDWTYSPFVAMHFATDDVSRMKSDGIIWCVNMPEVNKRLPKKLKSAIDGEGSYVFTIDMLAKLELPNSNTPLVNGKRSGQPVQDLDDFDKLSAGPFAIFIEPPSIDDRIINQFALFSAISDSKITMDEWLKSHPKLCKKVIIPSKLKWEVRDKLDQANINERVIYPGLDGLSSWLKRHYSNS